MNSDHETSTPSPRNKKDELTNVAQNKSSLNLDWLRSVYSKIMRNQIDACDLNLQVRLDLSHLWQEFNTVGTEMIITKCGRRMFPNFRITIRNMKPNESYILLVDVIPADVRK